jgi:hypothetical protein
MAGLLADVEEIPETMPAQDFRKLPSRLEGGVRDLSMRFGASRDRRSADRLLFAPRSQRALELLPGQALKPWLGTSALLRFSMCHAGMQRVSDLLSPASPPNTGAFARSAVYVEPLFGHGARASAQRQTHGLRQK